MIGFAGLSHLGLVSSAAAAAKGFEVIAFDADAALVDRVRGGELPVVEAGLAELIAEHARRLEWTADLAALRRCDLVFVAIDVPTDADDRSDASVVEALLEQVCAATAPGTVLVVLSQVAPGFSRRWHTRVGDGRRLYYVVETLIFGRAVERGLAPERFMVGCAEPAELLPAPLRRYLDAFGCPVLPMRYESAELCKISINCFLVASLATTNLLAEVCEAVGAEWREIAPALRLDARIGPHAYVNPGLGIGGGNLRRDLMTVRTMADDTGVDASLVDAWLAGSRYRRDWALRELHERVLSREAAPSIAMWGLAYKENTASTKNSAALILLDTLRDVPVLAYDPAVPDTVALGPSARRAATAVEACVGADALVIMTPWSEFTTVDWTAVASAMRRRVLVDPWGVADLEATRRLGFEYTRLGTGGQAAC